MLRDSIIIGESKPRQPTSTTICMVSSKYGHFWLCKTKDGNVHNAKLDASKTVVHTAMGDIASVACLQEVVCRKSQVLVGKYYIRNNA